MGMRDRRKKIEKETERIKEEGRGRERIIRRRRRGCMNNRSVGTRIGDMGPN